MAQIDVPSPVRGICDTLTQKGHGAWIVGGCVRDSLRNAAAGISAPVSTDWDIATSARPEHVKALFRRVIPTGIEHGTVTVIIDQVHYEVTTLRADVSYSDGRRPDKVEFVEDIVADLARRDFTVNAIAYDVARDALIDPFEGMRDLTARCLRAVGEPARRFAEDGLRVLRAARFVATLEFTLDPQTAQAIRPSLASYQKVSAERIRDEWFKALKGNSPSAAFRIMQDHGMLEITAPNLYGLQPEAREHAFGCLDAMPHLPTLQLAALLHALHVDPLQAANAAKRLLHDLRCSNQECDRVQSLIAHHRPDYQDAWSDAEVRRWLKQIGVDTFDDVLTLSGVAHEIAEAEALRRRAQLQVDAGVPLTLRELAITGKDLMTELKLAPGPQLGTLLERLLALVLEDPSLNQRGALLQHAAQWVQTQA
jgi:tRNA nucleotidyltransferase (CCA-adding enzyme)